MLKALTNIEVKNSDKLHDVGQVLTYNLSKAFGRSFKVISLDLGDTRVEKQTSTLSKVIAFAVTIVFFPIILISNGIGALLLSCSKSHTNEYARIQRMFPSKTNRLELNHENKTPQPTVQENPNQVSIQLPELIQPSGPIAKDQPALIEKVATFHRSLEAADQAFKKLDRVPDDKTAFENDLKLAYDKFHEISQLDNGFLIGEFFQKAENLNKMSRLFYLWGRLKYGAEMEQSRQFLQLALVHKLVFEGIFPISTIKKFEEFSARGGAILPEEILKDIRKEDILNIADRKQLLEISHLLRFIGHTCQNISALKTDIKRFELIYGLAKEINQTILSHSQDPDLLKEANWEMVELLYNTERFMHHFQAPNDALGKLNLLNNVIPYLERENSLRATTKLAQIQNILALEKSKMENKEPLFLEEIYQHSCKALEIAERTPDFDLFLLTMFRSNNVAFLLNLRKDHLEPFVPKMEQVLKDAEKVPHYYIPSFYMVAARLHFALNNKIKALELLDAADVKALNSPENAEESLAASKKLRDEINNMA